MKKIVLFICVACLPRVVGEAFAFGPVPAPEIREGQFVYAVPADFDPPLIGADGMVEINEAAGELHYPFYVVLARALPGSADKDEDDRAAEAVDGLAED
jgi:hypothetical protein